MKQFLVIDLILAVAWLLVTADFGIPNLLLGIAIGTLVLFVTSPIARPEIHPVRILPLVRLAMFVMVELVVANIRIAIDIVTPRHRMLPGVIAVPLDATSEVEIATLADLISLTPGSLALDVTDDRRILFVHMMYIPGRDVEAQRRRIKETMERRVRIALER